MANPTLHGYTVCSCIVSSAPLVEKRFREAGLIKQDFSGLISQGCYSNSAVAASAKTHNGGGVLDMKDFTPYRADADVLFTACGWIDFYRPYGILYKGSPAHHHVVLNGCPHLYRPDATNQLRDALIGLNGLAGKGKDSGPRPGITWQQAVGIQGTAPTPPPLRKEDDMNPIFMQTTGETDPTGKPWNPLYILTPGKEPHHLSPDEWTFFKRLGFTYDHGFFLKSEVMWINSLIQPAKA